MRLINPAIHIALRAGGFLYSFISPEILWFSLVVQIIIVHATQNRRSLYKYRDHEQKRKNAGKNRYYNIGITTWLFLMNDAICQELTLTCYPIPSAHNRTHLTLACSCITVLSNLITNILTLLRCSSESPFQVIYVPNFSLLWCYINDRVHTIDINSVNLYCVHNMERMNASEEGSSGDQMECKLLTQRSTHQWTWLHYCSDHKYGS